jgi:hypothetical protein
VVGTLSLLLRRAGETDDPDARQVTATDLGSGRSTTGNSHYVTIVVTRPSKDATSLDEYSVPIEQGGTPSAALSQQTMAHE